MAKGIDSYIRERFQVADRDIRTYSPLTLAYIGDGVYDLVIRSIVVGRGNTRPHLLHEKTSSVVKAKAQSAMIAFMLPEMTEEEKTVYRRGRNAKSVTMAKNATMAEYRKATGFEALIGYLYLTDQTDRMLDLIAAGLKGIQADI
jgi:ribonuclease-3 family protein